MIKVKEGKPLTDGNDITNYGLKLKSYALKSLTVNTT